MKRNQIKILLFSVLLLAAGFALGWFVHQTKKESSPIYALWDNQTVYESDVLPSIQQDLDQLEKNKYQIKKKATENFIQQKIAQKNRAESVGKPPSASGPAVSDFKNIELSPAEIDSFLKARSLDRKKMSPLEMQNVMNNLKLQKQLQAEKATNQTSIQNSNIHYKIPLPEEKLVKVSSGRFPELGPPKAQVQIILVSNFNCPQCSDAEKKLVLFKEKYKDLLQVSYRFLMNEVDQSLARVLAEAAYCADDQKRFWDFHDFLATASGPISETIFPTAVEKLNLNKQDFEKCLQSRKHRADLDQDMKELSQFTNLHPPSFIINGHLRLANEPNEELFLVIDQYL